MTFAARRACATDVANVSATCVRLCRRPHGRANIAAASNSSAGPAARCLGMAIAHFFARNKIIMAFQEDGQMSCPLGGELTPWKVAGPKTAVAVWGGSRFLTKRPRVSQRRFGHRP